jgi:hypothetical protein
MPLMSLSGTGSGNVYVTTDGSQPSTFNENDVWIDVLNGIIWVKTSSGVVPMVGI